MSIPMRWFCATGLGLLALLGPLSPNGHAQFRPGVVNPALFQAAAIRNAAMMNLNPYVHPFAAQSLFNAAMVGRVMQGRAILATAGLTHPLAALSGAGFGYHLGGNVGFNLGARYGAMMGMGYGNNLGYGSLLNGGMGGMGGMGGGYGAGLASSALMGAGYGYGFGLGNVQWMMNPYQGYLQGAASITRANADYYKTIQQAKLTREEARRSALQTRRAMIEEIQWEREQMPDPEKLRQKALERELTNARRSPPLTDIFTARSLNALLRNLMALQSDGVKGPDVPLDEDIVKHINVTPGNTGGNLSLLKNKGTLEWPESLTAGIFKEDREKINSLMKAAYNALNDGRSPANATLQDLQAAYEALREKSKANTAKFDLNQDIEINRYLGEINNTLKALNDENAHKLLGELQLKSKNVADAVKFMRDNGLQFAPASEQDLAAYMAMYNALATYDAALPRVASRGGALDDK
jgi:hypothetical protein